MCRLSASCIPCFTFYIFYAIISDQRGLILMGFISVFAQYHYFVKPISKKLFFLIFLIIFLSIIIMTGNRVASYDVNHINRVFMAILNNFMGRNGIEISKTAIILGKTDETQLLWGLPFIDSILILVPKVFYPEKTTINFATYIAHTYFDIKTYGAGAIPPGLIAELFVNFWYTGFFLLPFLGWLISRLDLWLIVNKFGIFYQLLYFHGLYSIGGAILGSSIADTFTSILLGTSVLGISYFFCKTCRVRCI